MEVSKKEQKSRWLNALKQAARINRIQKKGDVLLIWDDEFVHPSGRFILDENRLLWKSTPDTNCLWCLFINDPNLDNGLYDSVKKYNKKHFGNIMYCEKKHLKKLV